MKTTSVIVSKSAINMYQRVLGFFLGGRCCNQYPLSSVLYSLICVSFTGSAIDLKEINAIRILFRFVLDFYSYYIYHVFNIFSFRVQ